MLFGVLVILPMKIWCRLLVVWFSMVSMAGVLHAEDLVATASLWTYWDKGGEPGSGWKSPSFDDSQWKRGVGPLGYGNRGEVTVVDYGSDPQHKYLTTYFRQTFEIDDPTQWLSLQVELLCDDGAVVYLNGQELLRENMPAGEIDSQTLSADRGRRQLITLDAISPTFLVVGRNTIAAEVHQWRPGSSDLYFQLALSAERALEPPVTEDVTLAAVLPEPGSVTELDEIQVTFSRPVWGVDAHDLLMNGESALSVQGMGTTYTFSLPVLEEGRVMVTWNGNHAITGSGSPVVLFDAHAEEASWVYDLEDLQAPRVTRLTPVPGATLTTLQRVEVWFNEPVTGVEAADLWAAGRSAIKVEGSGAGPYCFEFEKVPTGIVLMRWAVNHGIRDLSAQTYPLQTEGWFYEVVSDDDYADDVVIQEIMYHPVSGDASEEFIELVNRGAGTVNLTGWRFSRGVDYSFPTMSLEPGAYLVVAADETVFQAMYSTDALVVGNWQGRLSNGGETLELVDAGGERVDRVSYADEGDWAVRQRGAWDRGHQGWTWYSVADGEGASLELCNPLVTNNAGQNWKHSLVSGGTPGQANSVVQYDTPP